MNKRPYLQGGYYQDGKKRREIYIEWAKDMAVKLSQGGMTMAALRRFYGQIKAIQPLMVDDEAFEVHKEKIYPIIPLANYAANKEEGKVPEAFRDFIEKNMELSLQNRANFLAFIDHFQSIVAYFKEPSNTQRGRSTPPSKTFQHNKQKR
ncbi:type III-A CRISPR-associated protein Csm2 [Cytobacillus dafuensis]|uniref:CRISPR system Cms protein Csm2 n=1 Tax=Cytobacillus dafuensis TaxID=1742359 RepID=A0A5B8Z4X5_CYTDA|nr:type III-A CRISPR-associated protein Csm2 [Cytobacillus dafuensis]QED48150.1 type III-A CRISPR-associated protein Csm2 [Cytobacillus dafuensis]